MNWWDSNMKKKQQQHIMPEIIKKKLYMKQQPSVKHYNKKERGE